MDNGKGMRVAECPIGQEYCYPSCFFRKENRCCFGSRRGRKISELKGSESTIEYRRTAVKAIA